MTVLNLYLLSVSIFCVARVSNKYSSPSLLAESPVQVSSLPKIAKSILAFLSIFTKSLAIPWFLGSY